MPTLTGRQLSGTIIRNHPEPPAVNLGHQTLARYPKTPPFLSEAGDANAAVTSQRQEAQNLKPKDLPLAWGI
jgi:hypothetical protein